jgi:cobalt-zinc-cadmium resistance protein CzcA
MIDRLVLLGWERPLLVVVAWAALAVAGVDSLRKLQVEAYPDISDPFAIVITTFPGYAAEEVEQQITIPIELALNAVPNVIERRSRTIPGLSVVELTFDDATSDDLNRQRVLAALQAVELPDQASAPELGPPSTGISEFYRYVLTSDRYDERDLREIQDWVVAPRLMQVPGVAEAVTFGGLLKRFEVIVDPLALQGFGLSASDVAEAIEANNRNAGGGRIDNGQQSLAIRSVGQIRGLEDIEEIVLGVRDGVPTLVRDVARVALGHAPQTGILGLDEQTGGVQGIVLMRRGENPSAVLAGITEAIEEIRAFHLPQGVELVTIHDRSDLVSQTLQTVSRTLVEGLTVVFLVLFFFLFSVRAALLTAIVMPLSLLFAFVCMRIGGVPASLLSLGALDFGILVDGTVVLVDHVLQRLSALGAGAPAAAVQGAIREALQRVARPIFFSMTIIIIAFLPLLTLQQVEGRLFAPMALIVCFALLGALLLSLTLVPVLARLAFRRGRSSRAQPLMDWLRPRYERFVRFSLGRAPQTVAAAALVVAAALGLATRLGTEFLPELDEGVIWIRSNLPPGTSLEMAAAVAADVRALIGQSPEVRLVASQTGRNEEGTDPFGPNRNEFLVELHPYGEWPRGRRREDLVAEIAQRLRASIPGATFNFSQPIIDTSTEIATGTSADLAIGISGPDLGELRRLAERTLPLVASIPGASDASIEEEADQAQLRIHVDRRAIARYGIAVGEVQEIVDLTLGGRPVSELFEGERRFDIALRYPERAREDADAIGRILVPSANGASVPLAQLARIEIADGASMIARAANQRQIHVRTNIRGRDEGGFVAEAQRRFAREIELPSGYQVSWGGKFENLERARSHMALLIPVTLGLIFSLLFVTFGSARLAAMVLASVPFAAVGGILGLLLRGMHLNVSAGVGFISLFGVTVMASVVLVSEIRRRQAEGVPLDVAIVEGALERMRTVIAMMLVAMLGIVPAALATGIGSDIQRPLATVLMGGLLAALVLILGAMPALYKLVAPPCVAPREGGSAGATPHESPAPGHA